MPVGSKFPRLARVSVSFGEPIDVAGGYGGLTLIEPLLEHRNPRETDILALAHFKRVRKRRKNTKALLPGMAMAPN